MSRLCCWAGFPPDQIRDRLQEAWGKLTNMQALSLLPTTKAQPNPITGVKSELRNTELRFQLIHLRAN